MKWPKIINGYYLSGGSDHNSDYVGELNVPEDWKGFNNFAWIGYEIKAKIEVYEDGTAYLLAINDMPLVDRVQI